MTASAIRQPSVTEPLRADLSLPAATTRSRSNPVRFLQAYALAVMLIPSTTVIGAIGAPGYPASLIGMFAFLVLGATILLGLYRPTRHRHPIQGVLRLLWLSSLATYVLMDRPSLSAAQMTGADRQMIGLAVITGISIVAAEWLHSVSDVRRVLRVLCWGGAFTGVVAALQYSVSYDLSQYLRALPGFTQNHINPAIIARGALSRATGTAITPIELGVVAGMLLPLAIYLGLYDRDTRPIQRWAPVALITMAIGTSVSRSAIVAVVVAFGVLVLLLPPLPRLRALAAVPFAVVGAFVSAHGLLGTLTSFFFAGTADSSVDYRLHDYPVVERLWGQAPWFGHGGGTYLPVDPLNIFDNQYLTTAVEYGAIGVVAMLVFFLVPGTAALSARRRSTDPEFRVLCAALAGAGFAGAFCSLTFDSMSFPMFVGVYTLVIGLIGACWRLAAADAVETPGSIRATAGRRPSLIDARLLAPVGPGRVPS
jgi:hypothetical protein